MSVGDFQEGERYTALARTTTPQTPPHGHEHPLAVYGNVAWTTFMTIVAGVPIVDIIVDTDFMCQLAQITSSLCGLFWALCYTVIPVS